MKVRMTLITAVAALLFLSLANAANRALYIDSYHISCHAILKKQFAAVSFL
jgi:hypothetical protein